MKHILLIFFLALLGFLQDVAAQGNNNVGINTNNPDPSAVLDVYSTNKGMLIPRMGSEGRKGIVNPALSLVVFDTDNHAFFYFDGFNWQQFNSTADSIWIVKENYIYTQYGKVGIGTDTALALLHIHSDTTSPLFMLSTPDYRTIIGLDETDGTIFINGDSTSGHPRRYFSLDTLGHLGLNVTTPDEALHIYDTTGVFIKLESPRRNGIIGLDETDGTIMIGRDSAGIKKPQLIIDTLGRIGIGVIDPNAQLNVQGKIKSRGVIISNGASQVTLQLDAQGNLNMPADVSSFYHAYRTTDITLATNTTHDVVWNGQLFPTTGTSFNHTINTANITITKAGYYKITYSLSIQNVDTKKMNGYATLYKNGVLVPGGRSYNGIRDDAEDDKGNLFQTVIVNVTAGDVIKLQVRCDTNSSGYNIKLLQNACSIVVEKL